MKKNKLYLMLSVLIALMLCLFSGCGSGTGSVGTNSEDWPYSNTPSQLDQTGIRIRLSNIQLPDLGVNNGTYELWAWLPGQDDIADHPLNIYPIPMNDTFVSLGKFVVTPNGKVMDPSRTILYGTTDQTGFPIFGSADNLNADLSKAYGVFVSIERAGEDFSDPYPGGIVLAGLFSNRVCPLVLYTPYPSQEFGSNINPSHVTLENAGNGTGIWFIKPGAAPYAGLDLPILTTIPWDVPGFGTVYYGLKYEAWVRDLTTGTYYSLGKFLDPENADALNPLTYSTMSPAGSKKYPKFPGLEFSQAGQNPGGFVASPLSLANGNYRSYITIEPEPDNDTSRPFIFLMESGVKNGQAALPPHLYLPSTLLGDAYTPNTQPMIKMVRDNHNEDASQFIFVEDQMVKATLE